MSFDTVESITEDDLRSLLGEPEGKQREYKRDLPVATDAARTEFVSDVSAMANSDGGDIFYGIREDDGRASEMFGVPRDDADAHILRLENILRDSLRPRMPLPQIRLLDIGDGKSVLILRIPKSHLAPHQNIRNGNFYARNSRGKYSLEASELTDMILRRESLPQAMRRFRHERIRLIQSKPEDMPAPIDRREKLLIHFFPEQSFGRTDVFDVGQLNDPAFGVRVYILPIWQCQNLDKRPNIDGYLYMNGPQGLPWYAQVFYDGTVEVVNGTILQDEAPERLLHPNWIEQNLFDAFRFAKQLYSELGAAGRVSVAITLLGLPDFTVNTNDAFFIRRGARHSARPIGRDPAILNEVTVEMADYAEGALWPALRQLWRAFGFNDALSYDREGNYTGYPIP